MMEECLLQVRDALASKVSKERVGTELEGMFKGMRHPAACMRFRKGKPQPLAVDPYLIISLATTNNNCSFPSTCICRPH